MPTVHDALPAERTGTPASPQLLERRAMFAVTDIDAALGVTAGDTEFAGVPCRTVRAGDRATILYLHGGGYRMGSPEAYNAYAAKSAAGAEATVVLPRYRLAPENPFPAGLRDAVAVYEALASAVEGPIVLAGDSAGAGLAAAVIVAAKAGGLRTPDGLMLLSPWLDLHCSSPFYETAPDVFFPLTTAESAREDYLQGAPASDPLASPLLADHAGFPPTLIQVGGSEALVGDALGLAASLATSNVTCTLEVVADQGHTWPLIYPDHSVSVASIESCARFVRSIERAGRG
ncbi:alpha/beta hydrolase fold domain-containing protein [Rhodococcus rhodochrous]|uniref:alpha/beta hydrolase fold domain-containing protein n=1 Tax=Rhodococcus rhodochrous TaxID=1829 RepID=UPI001E4C45F9|nr:alpha/beta hydrolase fold domain-containing protein [Rhodococcus rhodochrous]MCD2097504.1 alpha/beta hydrolase [Rhodococcus rhodochrous]MCD2122580.1 alpha/beta hydrolase [Rhodococcus rhodochrous]MCQ4133616.1 alpha/beta hydrolase [Rhodococcus rhodochrous]MDJ0018120.1 alpha/beta hydrolase fold domain-containing protein [Rhodococcus rhodochrous]